MVRGRSAGPLGAGFGCVAAGDEVSVPAQDCLWAYQQSESTKRLHRESVQQGREQGPVAGGERWTGVSRLPFQDGDLVP